MAQRNEQKPGPADQGPDPATCYERAKPDKEAGMGRLDNNEAIPAESADCIEKAVGNKQPLRQLNAEDIVDGSAHRPADGKALNTRSRNRRRNSSRETA